MLYFVIVFEWIIIGLVAQLWAFQPKEKEKKTNQDVNDKNLKDFAM